MKDSLAGFIQDEPPVGASGIFTMFVDQVTRKMIHEQILFATQTANIFIYA